MAEISFCGPGRFVAVATAGLGLACCNTTSTPSSPAASSSAPSPGYFDGFRQKPGAKVLLIQSNPGGAQAKTSFGKTCTTPCTMLIGESSDFTVSFTLAGHEPQTVTVHVKVDPGGWMSSPSLVFDPPSLFATLAKEAPPAAARKGGKPRA